MRLTLSLGVAFFLSMVSIGQAVQVLDFDITATLHGEFTDLGVGAEGRIYLLEGKNGGTVKIYSPDLSQCLSTLNLSRLAGKKVHRPVALTVADDGSFWVSDSGSGILFHFDAVRLIETVDWPENGSVMLKNPSDIVLTRDGRLVVADSEQGAVLFLDAAGELQQYIPGRDGEGIRFENPIDLAIGPAGNVYVVDGKKGGVCKIDAWGVLRRRWGGTEGQSFQLPSPRCIACDEEGLVYIADAEEDRCLVISGSEVVALFGAPGSGEGGLRKPSDMVVAPSGEIIILDEELARVQIYRLPSVEGIRISAEGEDRFLPLAARRRFLGDWTAVRVDVMESVMAVLGRDRRSLYLGDVDQGSGGLGSVDELDGKLKKAADICFSGNGRLYLADRDLRTVLVFDLSTRVADPVPCPYGKWSRPVLLARGADGDVIVWDEDARMLSFVGGVGADRAIPVSARFKGDIVGIDATSSGDVLLLPEDGPVVRLGPSGPLSPDSTVQIVRATAACMIREALLIAEEAGGFRVITLAGEQYMYFGYGGGAEPFIDRVIDFSVQDSLVLFCDADGGLGSYVLHNLYRSAIDGVIVAPADQTFLFSLQPLGSAQGRAAEWEVGSGPFSLDGLLPGVYTYGLTGRGWRSFHGTDRVWLRAFRVTSLGTMEMEPGGSVTGSVLPSGTKATLFLLGPESQELALSADASGVYSANELAPGKYKFTVDAPGFRADSSAYHFMVKPGIVTQGPLISLVKLGNIKGVIKPFLETGEIWVLEDGKVTQVCHPESFYKTFDDVGDSLGRFSCEDLQPGNYELIFRAPGYYPDTSMVPIALSEGSTMRTGVVLLHKTPADKESNVALADLQKAVDDYGRARFDRAADQLRRLLGTRVLPYSALARASWLWGQCLMAQGGDENRLLAENGFLLALLIDPYLSPGPETSPRVRGVFEGVRQRLFGEHGPPEGLY